MEEPRDQWERPEMRDALARRDIGAVFTLLIEGGRSQREIAELTGQNQSEVSEIIGGRQVMAYDLLVRIAERLGIPRGYLGLAYDVVESPPLLDEQTKRAGFLALAARAVVSEAVLGPAMISKPVPEVTPVPSRAGIADVAILHRVLDDLARLEQQFGGGVVLPAVEGQLVWPEACCGRLCETTCVRRCSKRSRCCTAERLAPRSTWETSTGPVRMCWQC